MEHARDALAAAVPFAGDPVVWVEVGTLGALRFSGVYPRRSRFNPVSALCCLRLAVEAQESFERVVLLTPYRAQARLLASLVNDAALTRVEIGTIHRYQGSEAPAVIVDLVDGTGRTTGRPFQGVDGERLLTVGLSRAQGKLIVVGTKHMQTNGLTRLSIDGLKTVMQQKRASLELPWRYEDGRGLAIEMHDDLTAGVAALTADDLVAAWMPDDVPVGLAHLDGPHVDRWPGGHVAWLAADGRFGLHSNSPDGGVSILTSKTPRFAEALADAVTGAPLTRRSAATAGADERVSRAARHDRCGRCGGSVIPFDASKYSVELGCAACKGTRRASDREIAAWLREVGPCCPDCGMAMVLRPKGRYGPFLSCSTYPACSATLPLEALCDAALNPDPPPPVEREVTAAPPARRASTVGTLDRRTCTRCFCSKLSALYAEGSTICDDCL